MFMLHGSYALRCVGTLQGSNSAILSLPPFRYVGQLVKEKHCSPRSNFFPLKVDISFKSMLHNKCTFSGKLKKALFFVKMERKNI